MALAVLAPWQQQEHQVANRPRRGALEEGAGPGDDAAPSEAAPNGPRHGLEDDPADPGPAPLATFTGRRLADLTELDERPRGLVPVEEAVPLPESPLPDSPLPDPARGARARRAATSAEVADAAPGPRSRLGRVWAVARPRHSTVRGDIEGLRAIAVVLVLLYHLGIDRFSGGFAGVDVFFVISGFLITSQLLSQARRTGRLDLADFYARRARRLLPAATIVLVTTVLVGWAWLPRSEWQLLAKDSAAAAVYAINWSLAGREVDYLAEDAHPTAVQHYWSLAVEEQFYLVWPLLIIAALVLARRRGWRPIRTVVWALVGVLVASLVWSRAYTTLEPGPAYFVSTTRAWELAIGALVAAAVPHLRRIPARWASTLAAVGLAMVVASAFALNRETPWPGHAALLPTVGTALVVLAGSAHDANPTARLLSLGPLPWLGMLSYSMYLWHWPLIVFATARDPHLAWWEMVMVVVLTITLSALTLRLVEDPVRYSDWMGRHRWTVWASAVVAMACSLVASLALLSAAPRLTTVVDVLAPGTSAPTRTPAPSSPGGRSSTPARVPADPVTGDYTGALALVHNSTVTGMPTLRADLTAALAVSRPMVPDPAVAGQDLPLVYTNGCHREKSETRVVRPDQCIIGDSQGSTAVVMVGDSKMDQWQPAFDVIGQQHGWRIQGLGKSGCAFSSTKQYAQCDTYNAAVLTRLLADVPDIVVTSTYDQNNDAAPGMIDLLSQLERAGAQIVLINDNPTPPGGESVYQCVTRTESNAACSFEVNVGHGAPALTQVLVSMPQAAFVDLNDWVCPPALGRCPVAVGNVFLYRQSSHLTNTYVRSLTPILERSLVRAEVLDRAKLPLQPR